LSVSAKSRNEGVSDGQYSAEYHYLANSPLVEQIELENGTEPRMTTWKQYDQLNRLVSIQSQPSNDKSIRYACQYNQANQGTSAILSDSCSWKFTYHELGQVTSAKKVDAKQTAIAGAQFEYAYDTIGNRTRTSSSGENTKLTSWLAKCRCHCGANWP
jgi:hypothetical protein